MANNEEYLDSLLKSMDDTSKKNAQKEGDFMSPEEIEALFAVVDRITAEEEGVEYIPPVKPAPAPEEIPQPVDTHEEVSGTENISGEEIIMPEVAEESVPEEFVMPEAAEESVPEEFVMPEAAEESIPEEEFEIPEIAEESIPEEEFVIPEAEESISEEGLSVTEKVEDSFAEAFAALDHQAGTKKMRGKRVHRNRAKRALSWKHPIITLSIYPDIIFIMI